MPASDYLASAILNKSLRGVDFTVSGRYVALFTTAPTSAGGGVEVSAASYARQSATFSAPAGASGSKACTNSADILFPQANESWGTTILAWGLYDASTGGNLLFWDNIAAAYQKVISQGDAYKVAAGDLSIGEA